MKRILFFTMMCLFGLFSLNAQDVPQNLVATANGLSSITLTWDAVEGAEDYYVYKDGQLWANTSGATTYTENGLAAGTECCFAVQAVGAAGESELSAEVCATTETIQLAENEIVIGTATTKYYSPFLTILGGGSWFEAIYKSEEIGKACTISELAFSYKDGAETLADINIYLAETTKDEYASPNDATAESELTLVYSGTAVTLCDEEWETFVLNAPFNYSGENNLLVVVTTENTSKANNWNCYEDANSVLIKDVALDSKKPVMKLTLGEGGETPDSTPDPEPGDVCVVEFVLKDSYGDGWNGNTLVVTGSDGVSEVLGLAGGSSTTYTLQFAKGAHVTLLFTNNGNTYTYPQENSLIVRYESGIEIINQAEGSLTSGLTFEFDVDCTPVAPEAPTVVAQTISDTEIALTLTAAGAETFTVYQGTEVLVENYVETTYVVSGLTPETEYCFTAKSFNEVGESELSEEVCATTYKEGTMIVQVGESDGHTAWSTPVADYYYYSMSQTIYTAEEIGVEAGSIVSVAYNKASGSNNTRNISVYMKHTNDTILTAWDTLTSDMCVYNGTYTFGEPGWNTIVLQEAFSYEGGNLLVCVVDNTAVNATSYDMFYTYKPGVQRAIYGQSSSSPIDPSNTTINSLPIYDNSYAVRSPQTKFVIEPAGETPTPSLAAPQNLVATVNGQSSITLTWDAVEGAGDYYVYKDGQMWANTSGATTYTENGLAAGTECCFAVQAAGAAGESELSAEVCATTEATITEQAGWLKYDDGNYVDKIGLTYDGENFEQFKWGVMFPVSDVAEYAGHNITKIALYDCENYTGEVSIYEGGSTAPETLLHTQSYICTGVNDMIEVTLTKSLEVSGDKNVWIVFNSGNGKQPAAGCADQGNANGRWIYYDGYGWLDNAMISMSALTWMIRAYVDNQGGEGGNDEPAEITHRLVGIYQNEWNNVAYTYESETSNVVTEVVSGSHKTVLEYNEDGQIVKTTYAWVDPNTGEMDLSQYTLVTYTYADGVLASYKEDIFNSWNPSSTEYTFTYEDNFVVKEWPNAKETYAFEDGRLVEKTKYYYDQWVETPDFVKENMVKYEYDENGNCVTETQYNTYGEEPTPQNGVDYYYDMTIAAENVATFAYPHEFLPTHANLVTKALLYYYQEDWQTHEVFKSNFEVKTYNYSPEVAATPFAPMELKANVVSDVEISLTWVSIEAAESFNVYCNGELAGNATETYFTVTGLTAATEYCFTVKGVSSGVESEASNEACATTMQLVNIVPNAIAFGDVKMGEFWTETSTSVEVKIDLLGKTITSIATDNDFFRVPATINLTEDPVTFKVDYKKGAEAGEYTGNLLVMVDSCYTVSIPLSATAYNPVAPDVFELAQEIEFVEGAYTDAPDFATLHDDYNLPNEAEGNNPDAVYTFTLDTESVVNVEVTGENAVYATYKAFGEEEGPTAANAFFGEEIIFSTSFSYDFESADLSDFTIVDNDEFKDYTWTVENGSLVSYSFLPTPDYSYPYYVANDADERLITNKAYAITANSVLTLDINVNGSGGSFNWGEAVFIEVTQDGETFTQVGVAYDDESTYSYEFMSKRINIGAKFAELGLEYGEYQIVLHHDQTAYGAINVDNLALTERANVYPAGTYYLVAAAPAAFEVNVEVAVQEMPVAPKAYRLVSTENHAVTTYVYDATDVNRVVRIESEGTADVLEYNTDGTLAGYKTIVSYEDPELGNVEQEVGAVSYVYENGRIVSYSETVHTFDVESVITYNAEGQVESIETAAYESVTYYEYNAEGMLAEKVTAYVYGEEVSYDSKEVYTYENGKLVKIEYMYYDWESEEGEWYAVEEYVYTYDANGNCTLESAYQFNENFETGEVTKSLYNTTEYYYNTEVLAADVYTFEYPHFALLEAVKPATVNVLTKTLSYYSYVDEATGEVVDHSHTYTTYNYDPEILSAPFAPTNLVATAVNTSEIVLSWDAVEGAEQYNVYSGDEYLGYITTASYVVNVVEYGTHCYTVTAVNEAGESEHSNEACATIELPHFWTPDPYLYANNMTIITTIAIDGVEQSDLNLELGAFCGDEVRGSGRLQYVGAPANRYECFLMVYGNSNDNITFKLYDHSTSTVSDIKSNQSVSFEVNGTVGDIVNPYIINFINTIVHNQALTSGWNWYSTYVINEGAEGLANLENAIGTNGIQIKNQTQFVNQASGNWYGTLTETSVEDMFMIQMSSAADVALEGYEVNPADYPITLGTNWKWISYPLSASISVEDAFANANPSNGDYVKSQTGFAQYYDGLGWSGTLTNMTPGMGYMYQNKSGYAKTLVYPTPNSKSVSESMSESESIYHWTADYAQYPMNMTMIAVVEGAEKDYEVAAFANGECRGSARPIYIEALDSYMIFMTISGDDNESLTFKYYDVTTGEEVAIENNMIFTVNATVGDVMNPYVMTRGTMGIDDLSSSINIYPNPVEDELFVVTEMNVEEVAIYDVYGRLCCRDASNASTSTMDTFNVSVQDLEAGVYFVNIKTDGGNIVKRFVKK